MKYFLSCIVLCVSVVALAETKEEPKKPVEKVQVAKERCKFSDDACKRRNQSKATRALKRLSKF